MVKVPRCRLVTVRIVPLVKLVMVTVLAFLTIGVASNGTVGVDTVRLSIVGGNALREATTAGAISVVSVLVGYSFNFNR